MVRCDDGAVDFADDVGAADFDDDVGAADFDDDVGAVDFDDDVGAADFDDDVGDSEVIRVMLTAKMKQLNFNNNLSFKNGMDIYM